MNAKDFATRIFPKSVAFRLARLGVLPAPRPITLTFSVTNMCQSRCKTCQIWRIYPDHLQDVKNELSLEEIERVFASMGHVYFFNLSGGEPFLRPDIAKIVEAAVEHLRPAIIHSPTNAIATARVLARAFGH